MAKLLTLFGAAVLMAALSIGLASASGQWDDHSRGQLVGEIERRDTLIEAQESLLDAYRCNFNVDIELVPGECLDGEPAPIVTEDPVLEPLSPLSVRPSDHPDGLVCLEVADDAGSTWTWTDDQGDVTAFGTAFGVYTSGIQRGWATALSLEGLPESRYQDRLLAAAWHAQCASYHGTDIRLEGEQTTDPDDWKNQ